MIQNSGKKLTLFLVDGEPDGRKTLALGGWSGMGLMFPRNKLKEFGADETSQRPGVYFLFGRDSDDSLVTSAYIGEAENLFNRLSTHNNDKAKDYWYMTVAFVANDNSLTKAHVKYLESRCIELAQAAQHFGYSLKNGKESLPAFLPDADIPMMEEFLGNISLILAAVGYPVLQKVEAKAESDGDNPLFYCQSRDQTLKGTARMTNEGFIVYKGTTLTAEQSVAVAERNLQVIKKLLTDGIIIKSDSGYRFEQDYRFTSPSAASDLILGNSTNGWRVWKTKEGKTLDEFYRHKT